VAAATEARATVMTPTSDKALLFELASGPTFRFADWPVAQVPRVAAGLYSIWEQETLLYVGMSGQGGGAGKEALAVAIKRNRPWGLRTRLASHASGRRSGDQFCVYVADYLVLPKLAPCDIQEIANRKASFDEHVKRYIRDRLVFRFALTESGSRALAVERLVKAGGLGQLPLLNPL
jgi:hypothetical protein